ncbi:MAG TPA: alpha/beta hydrolase [Candidatus Angelobacter sp.]|nr:alpha/beta hydrolase [Candidatus Angelobacter sp.]
MSLQSVDVGQVKLAYLEAGKGEPVILVHGIPTDYRAWSGQVGPFSRSHHVVAYSRRLAQPNRNEMDYEKSTVENNSADLVGLIEELGVSPVHLVGHSYGGFAAAYCASTNPELIRTLTLIEPAVSTMLLRNRKSTSEFLGLLFSHPSIAISAAKFQRGSLDPSLKAFRQGDFDAALRLNLDGIMNQHGAFERLSEPVRVMTKENERTVGELMAEVPAFGGEEASKISAPTLLIHGTQSPKVLHAIVDRLGRTIPHSEVSRISGAAHFPHFEKPKEFNELVLGFLSKHESH